MNIDSNMLVFPGFFTESNRKFITGTVFPIGIVRTTDGIFNKSAGSQTKNEECN